MVQTWLLSAFSELPVCVSKGGLTGSSRLCTRSLEAFVPQASRQKHILMAALSHLARGDTHAQTFGQPLSILLPLAQRNSMPYDIQPLALILSSYAAQASRR